MSISEPPLKKLKLEYSNNIFIETVDDFAQRIRQSTNPIKIIVDEDLFSPVPFIKVYIGHIKDPSHISHTVLILNEKIPLKGLQHLKRVRKRDIILCPVHFLTGRTSIQEYIESHVHELHNIFEYFKEIDVPYLPPKVSSQYREANKVWSVNFHPNHYLESIISNKIFKDKELAFHRNIMALAFEVVKWYTVQYNVAIDESNIFKNLNVAIVLDPKINSIAAIAVDNHLHHPMQHAAMLAIDNVAKTQNGGAWSSEESLHEEKSLSGINKELYSYLKENFPEFSYGARPFMTKDELTDHNEEYSNAPYLCTGYYIYMLREPCVMCAMGLIHARIKRVFFVFDNKSHGALKSKTKLHLNPSLNHRFEAFSDFL